MLLVKRILSFFLVLSFLGLAACGSSTAPARAPIPVNQPPPPPPPPPPPSPLPPIPDSSFNTNEFRFSYGPQAVNPIPAYEAGGNGQGVLVAVIDSGFDTTHTDLAGVYDAASVDLISGAGRGGLDTSSNHGAQVSGVIAAKKNGKGMHGIAFNAKILAIRADAFGTCDGGDCEFFVSDIADGIFYAVDHGAKIINISLGGDGITQRLRDAFAYARDAGVLIITSAGNDEMPDPNVFSQTPGLPEFLGSGLIVGAVDKNLDLASFSNRAGNSQQAFLVAPGVSVGTVNINNLFARVSGTSFAAPYVAGAAAILLDLFPNLDAQDLFDILTQTAHDLGTNGRDATFGWGLVDIGAAIMPLGPTAFITASVEGDGATDVPTDETGTGFSLAFGDAPYRIDGLSSVMILDSFRRSYKVDAKGFMTNLFEPSFSLLGAIDRDRNTRSLFLPLTQMEGLSLSFSDPNYREEPYKAFLPRGIQDRMRSQNPYLYFDAKFGSKTTFGASFGFSPGLAMDRLEHTQNLDRDFLAASFDSSPHLALSQDTKSLALSRTLFSNTTVLIATAFGIYDFSKQLPVTQNLPTARALSSVLRIDRKQGRVRLSLTTGFLKEDNAVLGSISTGALSLGSGAMTGFAGFRGEVDLGRGFAFSGQYTSGWTQVENAGQTFFTDIRRFRTSSFSTALVKSRVFKDNDRLGVALYQPLRVESGNISLLLPTGRDYVADRILFTSSDGSLAPSSRELDVEVSYRIFGRKGYILEANYIHQFNPGHTVDLAHAEAFLLRVSKRY